MQNAVRIRNMIEIAFDEFERNMEKYFNAILNGSESVSYARTVERSS